VLLIARLLADEDDRGALLAGTEHGLSGVAPQRTIAAMSRRLAHGGERGFVDRRSRRRSRRRRPTRASQLGGGLGRHRIVLPAVPGRACTAVWRSAKDRPLNRIPC